MEQLNGFELAGRAIKVSHVTESSKESSSLDSDEADKTGVNLGASGKLALMAKLAEGTGMKVPQYTLDALNMSTVAAANISQTIYNNSQKSIAPMIPLSTQCLIVSNMFDLSQEISNPNWQIDLENDLINECNKYGGLVHCQVDTTSKEGNVYIKCASVNVALAVSAALNGRFFGGRMIKSAFIPITNYHQLFPESEMVNLVLKASK
jgi:RNA-binding protein 23/39